MYNSIWFNLFIAACFLIPVFAMIRYIFKSAKRKKVTPDASEVIAAEIRRQSNGGKPTPGHQQDIAAADREAGKTKEIQITIEYGNLSRSLKSQLKGQGHRKLNLELVESCEADRRAVVRLFNLGVFTDENVKECFIAVHNKLFSIKK